MLTTEVSAMIWFLFCGRWCGMETYELNPRSLDLEKHFIHIHLEYIKLFLPYFIRLYFTYLPWACGILAIEALKILLLPDSKVGQSVVLLFAISWPSQFNASLNFHPTDWFLALKICRPLQLTLLTSRTHIVWSLGWFLSSLCIMNQNMWNHISLDNVFWWSWEKEKV